MRKKKIIFNYPELSPLDIVHCAGKSPFALITRWVTTGWKNRRNYGIAVHDGILIDFHGQLLIAEMQSRGLEINSLERYNVVGGKRWVINITRNEDLFFHATAIQRQIAIDRRRTIEYDFKGLLEFVFKKAKDNKRKNYCSEYIFELTKKILPYPESFNTKVSPYNLQSFAGFKKVEGWNK